jgi:probable HAF family extracellular repeat protein
MKNPSFPQVRAFLRCAQIALSFGAYSLLAQNLYTLTDLGTLGGSDSFAYGINNRGQVIGNARTTNNTAAHAFLHSPGSMLDLGTLGGNNSYAYGVNTNGQVVGLSDRTTNDSSQGAFLYTGGLLSNLSHLGGTNVAAYAINDNGQIAGSVFATGAKALHAYIYGGAVTNITGLPSARTSEAYGLNNRGEVVGYFWINNTTYHGFLYSSNQLYELQPFSAGNSEAVAINDGGQVVGDAYTASGQDFAFLYSGGQNGTTNNLGTLGGNFSQAFGINNRGQVVGQSEVSADTGPLHAFLYSGGVMYDLNSLVTNAPGWTLTSAQGINDLGQITGTGTDPFGNSRAFLLTPLTTLLTLRGTFSNGVSRLSVKAQAGLTYFIEATSDLVSWQVVSTTAAQPDGSIAYAETNAPALKCRFYRILWVP